MDFFKQKDTEFIRGKAVRMALACLNPSNLRALNMHGVSEKTAENDSTDAQSMRM